MTAPSNMISQPFINPVNGGVYLDNGSFTTDGSGGITAVSIVAPTSLSMTALTVVSGAKYGFLSGGDLAPTSSSQTVSLSGTLNMTSGLNGGNVLYASANSATASVVTMTPTSSASTTGVFQDGLEITVVNLAISGSSIIFPTVGGLGSYSGVAPATILGGSAAKFKYVAALQTWIHVL